MKAFCLAFQFLTILRLPFRHEFSETDFVRSLRWFFAAGLFIGTIQWVTAITMIHFRWPMELTAVIVAITGVVLSGGLHLDGVADTADGFGAGHDRNSILSIMKDERLGVYGVAAIVITLYLRILASKFVIEHSDITAFVVAPMMSRSLLACTCSLLPYAKDSGIGKAFSKGNFLVQSFPSLILSVFLTILAFTKSVWIPLAFTAIAAALFCGYCYTKIRGYTGDTLGFQNELTEIVFLFAY